MIRWLMISAAALLFLISDCRPHAPQLTFAVGGAPSEIEYWEEIISEFRDSTHIDVVFLRQPTDTDQRRQGLVIPLEAKEDDPDIFLMDLIWVAQFAASDWLLALDTFIQKGDLDTTCFFSSIIQQVDTYDGRIIALPVYNDCGVLYYRSDLLDKYGFKTPTTWQDLISSAIHIQKQERLHNPNFYGFVWQGAQYEGLICNYLEFLGSHGGSLVDSIGRLSVQTNESMAAVNMMKDLIHKYKISPVNTYTEMKEEEVRLFFQNSNALYERNWPYAWSLHRESGSAVELHTGITLLPRTAHGDHAATLGGWHVGISKYSDKKEHAFKLMQYIVSYKIQKKLALHLGWNPGRSDLYDDEDLVKRMPQITILKRAFGYARARPSLPYYTQISEILQRHINAVLAGKSKTDEALPKAQKEIDTITKTYHE
jgi:multiple sugar transport system substrate-binding protein